MRHLFRHWNAVERKLRGRSLMLFLDYDGTLAPLATTPGGAVMPPSTRARVAALAATEGVQVAVVSGRPLRDVKRRVGVRGVICAGNHGLELEGPGIRFRSAVPPRYAGILKTVKAELARRAGRIRGALLEDKGLSLALHYRLVHPRDVPAVKDAFRRAVAPYLSRGDMAVGRGKRVLEVRPPVDWDKGAMVRWLLDRRIPIGAAGDIVPLYVGDDVTDEDAFRALGRKGITVRVGQSAQSAARYYVGGTGEVAALLRRLLACARRGKCLRNRGRKTRSSSPRD